MHVDCGGVAPYSILHRTFPYSPNISYILNARQVLHTPCCGRFVVRFYYTQPILPSHPADLQAPTETTTSIFLIADAFLFVVRYLQVRIC